MRKNGRLVIISGPSGSGKTSICNKLTKNPKIKRSVSYTTRLPRGSEKEGVDYCFVERGEFDRLNKENKFIEFAEYCGNLYGTPVYPIGDITDSESVFILAIDVKGALQVMKKIPDAISIFIMAPDEETLKLRLRNRHSDNEDVINERVRVAKEEMEYTKYYNYCVINCSLDVAVKEIESILNV